MRADPAQPSTRHPPRFAAQFKRASPPEKHVALTRLRGSRTTLDDYRAYDAAVSEGWNVATRATLRISMSNPGATL